MQWDSATKRAPGAAIAKYMAKHVPAIDHRLCFRINRMRRGNGARRW